MLTVPHLGYVRWYLPYPLLFREPWKIKHPSLFSSQPLYIFFSLFAIKTSTLKTSDMAIIYVGLLCMRIKLPAIRSKLSDVSGFGAHLEPKKIFLRHFNNVKYNSVTKYFNIKQHLPSPNSLAIKYTIIRLASLKKRPQTACTL